MKNIFFYIKNNKKFFIIFFVIVLFFVVISTKNNKESVSTPLATPVNVATYKDLIPGSSSKEEVLSKLGTSLNAKINNNTETYEYLSSNPNFNSEVVVVDDKLSYVKIIYTNDDNIKYEDFTSIYGNPEKILYGPDYSVGYVLNVYPTKGLAFISHINSFRVREVWYFEPILFEMFIEKYAVDYEEKVDLSR